ncbi:MAG TPA: 4Fe-4S cluster-binding domain-containing protein [archaeon]|nr:4Fe-4S cluster-binding domain-containing protein [archaeon]
MAGSGVVRCTKVGPVLGPKASPQPPKGCRLCGRGAKLVLFATGRCDHSCFYCPISPEKKGVDRAFANERPVRGIDDLLDEARDMKALGAGVTGGDPLKSQKTFSFIQALKENFSPKFHIHLYTRTTDPRLLARAYDAGVDEIRFHWADPRNALALGDAWEVGAEVPVIPGQAEKLKTYIHKMDVAGVTFINLNEFEFSDSNFPALIRRGFLHKDGEPGSLEVEGSETLALDLLDWAKTSLDINLTLHYCSARTKLFTQLVERYKRTATHIARPFEQVTEEGTLLVGEVKDASGKWLPTSPAKARKTKGGRLVEYWPTFDRKPVEITYFGP